MKIITQLSDAVKELKEQNNLKNTIKQSISSSFDKPATVIDHQYEKPLNPKKNPRRTLAERWVKKFILSDSFYSLILHN